MVNIDEAAIEDRNGWRSQEELRLTHFFRSYGRGIRYAVGKILANPSDTDDVIQDAFLRVWRKVVSGVTITDPRSYILQAAENAARDKNRQHVRVTARTGDLASFDLPDQRLAPVDEQCHWRQSIAALEHALSELPPIVQSVFFLYHVEGRSIPDIAASAKKSTRTIERYLAKALTVCGDRMSNHRE